MKKILLAIIIGAIIMVLIDLLLAKVTSSMLSIPVSVFVGACVAGYISETKFWLIGLSVGCINSLISLIFYIFYVDEMLLHEGGFTTANVLLMPITTSIICGLLGGILSGVLRIKIPIY
jgi:hypothetical protein